MTDDELDLLLTAARPETAERLGALDLDAAFAALVEDLGQEERSPRRRRRLGLGIALGAALAAVLVLVLALASPFRADDDLSAYAAEAIAVAEANRRLLITEPGWSVDYIQWDVDVGDVTFVDDPQQPRDADMIEISWYLDSERFRNIHPDRPRTLPVEIAGEQAYVQFERARYVRGGYLEFASSLPASNGTITVIHGGTRGSREDIIRILESIQSVDVATWLGAMPKSVVQPQDQAGEVADLLEGVPLPEGFDSSALEPTNLPQDRTQLNAFVLRGAYCAWLDQWWRADKAGDTATADAAIKQLQAAPSWPAVQAQAKTGSLDQDFRQYAETVAQGYGDKQVYDQMENCIAY